MVIQAFYLPNAERPNLNVLVSAPVQKIITEDGKDGKIVATAVEYLSNGEIGVVRAKKEVILSAG
jgi:choline dehydrogenase-like flavoprotein